MIYLLYFAGAFALTYILTPAAAAIAKRVGAVDRPEARRMHAKPTPRLGGLAIFAGFVTLSFLVPIEQSLRFALLIPGSLIMLTGAVDDVKPLPPILKLLLQILTGFLVVAFGVTIGEAITNPLGGTLELPDTSVFRTLIALATVFWIVLVVNTINFLDGLDGISSGVSAIAAVTIFLLAIRLNQPEIAMLSAVLAGSAAGFLPKNFAPAKIFMGDSGSYFLGFILAMLSLIGGSKIATAILVLGIPLLDLAWAILRRLKNGVSIFSADTEHIHQRLFRAGLSMRQVALIFWVISAVFGLLAVVSETGAKLAAMVVLFFIMLLLILYTFLRSRNKKG